MAEDKKTLTVDVEVKEKGLEEVKTRFHELQSLGKQLSTSLANIPSLLGAMKNSKSLEAYTRNFEKVNSDLNKIVQIVNSFNSGLKTTSEEAKKASNIFEGFGRRVQTYFSYKIINAFTNSVTGVVSEVVRMQQSFANLQAITAATDGQMSSIKDTVYQVGINTKFSSEEIAEAATILGQAGLSVQEINTVLGETAKLASATGEDLSDTAALMTSALSVWNLSADQASHVADVMVTAANETKATLGTLGYGIQYAGNSLAQLGVSFEESAAVMAASTNAGLKSASMIGTGMRAVATELTKQSAGMKNTLASLGLTFDKVDIQALGLIKVLQNMKDAGFGATEAFAAFDRRAATYFLAATSQLDLANDLTQSFLETGSAAKAAETQMNTIQSQLVSLGDIITKNMDEAFTPLVKMFTSLVQVTNWSFKQFDGALMKFILYSSSVKALTLSFSGLMSVLADVKKHEVGMTFVEMGKGIKSAVTSVTSLTTAFKALKSVLALLSKSTLVWGALLTGIYYAYEKLFGGSEDLETKIANLKDEITENNTAITSLQTAYGELQKKQKLYTSDVDALNKRIAELNSQFGDKGFMVDYAEAGENLTDKLEEVRKALLGIVDAKKKLDNELTGKQIESSLKLNESRINDSVKGGVWDRLTSSKASNDVRDIVSNETIISKDFLRILAKKNKQARGANYINAFTEDMRFRLSDGTDLSTEEIEEITKELHDGLMEYLRLQVQKVRNDLESKEITALSSEAVDENGKGKGVTVSEDITNLQNQVTEELAGAQEESLNGMLQVMSENNLVIDKNSALEAVNKVKTQADESLKALAAQMEAVLKALMESGLTEEQAKKTSTYTGLLSRQKSIESQPSQFVTSTLGNKDLNLSTDAQLGLQQWNQEYVKNAAIKRGLSEEEAKKTTEYLESQIEITKTNIKKQEEDARKIEEARRKAEEARRKAEQAEQKRQREEADYWKRRLAAISRDEEETNYLIQGKQYQNKNNPSATAALSESSERLSDLTDLNRTQRYNELLNEMKSKYGSRVQYSATEGYTGDGTIDLSTLQEMNTLQEKVTEGWYKYGDAVDDASNKTQLTIEKIKKAIKDLNTDIGTLDGFLNVTFGNIRIKLEKEVGSIEKMLSSLGTEFVTVFNDQMSSALISWAEGTSSFSDAMKNMVSSVLQSLGEYMIQLGVKALALWALQAATPGLTAILASDDMLALTQKTATAAEQGTKVATAANGIQAAANKAIGGPVTGGTQGQDSVPAMLMPGEYVMKKSAVNALGTDFLNQLNNNSIQTMNAANSALAGENESSGGETILNVWVVSDKSEAQMGPNDVIATITKDMQTGGSTKKLVQTIVAGRKA